MSLVVTAASGHLGRLVVEELLRRGVPAGQIVAGARKPEKITDLAAAGVDVRRIDYDDPDSLKTGLQGAQRVLLISGTDFGRRVAQHRAVAQAAQAAGATFLAYTSGPYADTSSMQLMSEHRDTEQAIAEIGISHAFLRHSWYHENYTAQIGRYVEQGAIYGAAGNGRISGAPRADYAAADASVLIGATPDQTLDDGGSHNGSIHELGGDESYSLTDLAALVSDATSSTIPYRDISQADLQAALEGAGLPAPIAAVMADVDRAIRDDAALLVDNGELARLAGRPTTPLKDSIAVALA